ncbi:MAG: hypothetical protein IJZ89_08230 [Clostridia bacterium]|nr:hypothetical protein [Clostridia bacterium]
MKNKICFLLLTVLLCFSAVSCGDSKITYSFETLMEEHVVDGEFNRDVNILQIKTNSQHMNSINEAISNDLNARLEDYMNGAPVDWQHLVIDTTYAEKNGVLCITAIANNAPTTYVAPIITRSVYLDLENDTLYTFKEYAKSIGIDLSALEDEIGSKLSDLYAEFNEYSFDIEGVFYRDDDMMFIVQEKTISAGGCLILESNSTSFYDYTAKELIPASSSLFEGFQALE